MELNSKKMERTSRLIYFSISLILCLFLILLSGRIIDDLDKTTARPNVEQFLDYAEVAKLDAKIKPIDIDIQNLSSKSKTIEKTISIAKENYTNEKQSFDNWLQARKTLGSPEKDQEVIARAKKLDDFYQVEQSWRSQLNEIEKKIENEQKNNQILQDQIDKIHHKAEIQYEKELKHYDLIVFLIRLLFVAPILALGIFFFVRFRKHKFWPLYFGFTLFSIYSFFFGLVPYLPSYGGYVRYIVGIILSAGLGYYAIKSIGQYLERKQAELKVSTQERAKNVQYGVAEKALENHYCPSCGKDFIIKKWEFPIKNVDTEAYKLVTDFCRHCGLQLFKNCKKCGTKNFAHLKFCSACGTKQNVENERE